MQPSRTAGAKAEIQSIGMTQVDLLRRAQAAAKLNLVSYFEQGELQRG